MQFIYKNLGLNDFLDSIKYVKVKKFTVELRDFIFEELRLKSELAVELGATEDIISSRGDWVLSVEGGSSLLPYVTDVDYDQSLLLWHIATEICYNSELNNELKSKTPIKADQDHRQIAKLLSDYMMYLLIMQPSMISATSSIGQIQFQDTCAMAKKIFSSRKYLEVNEKKIRTLAAPWVTEEDWVQIYACMEILTINTKVLPKTMMGDQSKSLLFDGCEFAKQLMKIEEKDNGLNKWVIISKVWVEMLCYGASHSQANTQVAQVSKGGELITIVWLLMNHFGLGNQSKFNESQEIAKFIFGK